MATLGLGLLLPGAAWAAGPSHARRPLPTSLHAASVADTGSHGAGKRGKAAVGGRTGSRPAGSPRAETHAARSHSSGSGTGARQPAGKHRKGRKREEEAPEPVIPMFRAGRGRAPLEQGRGHGRHAQLALAVHADHASHAYGRRGHFAAMPAFATLTPTRRGTSAEVKLAHNTAPPPPSTPHHVARNEAPPPAPIVRNVPSAARQDGFAQGVSHPDDDERLPRVRNAPEDDGEAPTNASAAVSRVVAPPAGTPVVPAARTPLVHGFGGELAVPSSPATGTDRPGGTRRRGHPSNWQPEAMLTQPEPLEEREAVLDAAMSPAVLPEVYDRGAHSLMPAPLRGSRDVLVHQNVMAVSDGLQKIYDDADLDRLRGSHQLVSFPVGESLRINDDLPWNRRVARPWTVMFTVELARAFYQRFHQPLQVNSAARTVRYQAHLQMVNGNAAAVYGEAASPHLTGQAVDLAKRGMNQAELAWMRDALLPVMRSGKIDVEEEFQQACFHISVYRSYTANRRPTHELAQVRGSAAGGMDSPGSPDR